MRPFVKWYKGYLRIRLKGSNQERFINICSGHGIELTDLKYSFNGYICNIRLDKYMELRPIARKCGVIPLIKNRHGLPFIIQNALKHLSFIISVLLCFILIFILSGYLWNISFEGNYRHTDEELTTYLSELGIVQGTRLKSISCPEIEAALRLKFNDIGWASAEMKGTGIIIRIKENTEMSLVQKEAKEGSYDMISSVDGVIKSIVTRKGTALVKAGDSVKKGDVLIAGQIDIIGDNQEIIESKNIQADGDITIISDIKYMKKIQRKQKIKKYTGNEKAGYKISLFNSKIFSYNSSNPYETCDIIASVKNVELLTDFYTPLRYEEYRYIEYKEAFIMYTDKELTSRLEASYERYKSNLAGRHISITDEEKSISCGDNYGVFEVTLTAEAPFWKYRQRHDKSEE